MTSAGAMEAYPGTTLIPGEQLAAEWQDDIWGPPSEVSTDGPARFVPTFCPQSAHGYSYLRLLTVMCFSWLASA